MLDLLLQATSYRPDGSLWMNDARIQRIYKDVMPHRRAFLELNGLSEFTELDGLQARTVLTHWQCRIFGPHAARKSTFEQYLLHEYGGYKIVSCIIRLGVLDDSLLETHALDILSRSRFGSIPGLPAVAAVGSSGEQSHVNKKNKRERHAERWRCQQWQRSCAQKGLPSLPFPAPPFPVTAADRIIRAWRRAQCSRKEEEK
jgi:hypothetical protein